MVTDDPLIGKKLGDYTILNLLGRGGMSRVYKGYDENLDRYAAVKVIDSDFATTTEAEYTRRFQIEARAIAHLRHPNIVGVYQFGRSEGIYYMAQVFLEGKDLRSLLKEYVRRGERMPVDEVLQIVRDITSALDYAHEQGVIHRDIKPSNIMLERKTGRAILMDFGLALSVHEGTMGDTFGSAHYIAPEQAVSSAQATAQSDLYSLGVVIYEMLTGKVPFDDPSVMSVALKHLNEPPPPPTLYNPGLPPAVEAVILRALEKEPERRHPNGKALYEDLKRAFERAQPTANGAAAVSELLNAPSSELEDWPDETASVTSPTPLHPPSALKKPESPQKGLAGRFARRKAEKELQAALQKGELELDEQGLEALLSSYADPSEVGLVGEGAAGVTRPLPPEAKKNSDSETATPRKPRRSRVGCLLVLILLLGTVAAFLWKDRILTPLETAPIETTPTALSATAPTVTATHATSSGGGEVTETVEAASPTRTATAVHTSAQEPTQSTAEVAAAPSATATASPTETEAPPSATPTTASTTAVSTPSENANIRLLYKDEGDGEGYFVLINKGTKRLDISPLVFEQQRADGTTLRYEARWWARSDISADPTAMPGRSCFQLVTTNGTNWRLGTADCPYFLGYYRTAISSRYFWLSDDPTATFTVTVPGMSQPLATCPVGTNECVFLYDPDAAAQAIAYATAEAEAQKQDNTLRLIYDADSFLVVNTSTRTLDISQLIFEQEMPDGAVRHFEARAWERPDILEPPTRMEPDGCYQLVRADSTQVTPPRSVCRRFLGWFSTGLSRRHFWIAEKSGATFTVRLDGEEEPLRVCPIDEGTCTVYLPE